MKTINKEEAIIHLKQGLFVKCKVGRDFIKPVKSIQELENLNRLAQQKVQSFELFLDSVPSLPDNTYTLTFEEAMNELANTLSVYTIKDGEEKKIEKLTELFEFRRACEIWGDVFVLYKYK